MSDEMDESTNLVIDWIRFYGKQFIRINPSDRISDIEIHEDLDCNFRVNGQPISLRNVTSFWYRRGYLRPEIKQFKADDLLFATEINEHIRKENFVLVQYILSCLSRKPGLGKHSDTMVNKFEVLRKAKNAGLIIPETIVTTKKSVVNNFLKKHKRIVTKSSSEVILSMKNHQTLISYTSRVMQVDVDQLSETFAPSLFQNEIQKKFELRIFFIKNEFYPMAIFSQLDVQTEVDFRIYNDSRPNRNVPFELASDLKTKLSKLMADCNYNTGSIDMIVSYDDDYIFLEINPLGQFEMVSSPCNYSLHRRIADELCFT